MKTAASVEASALTLKWSRDELMRLAFIYGEQDRRSYAECNPAGSVERKEAAALAKAMHAYRVKRWGATTGEAQLANSKLVDINELLRTK